MPNTKFKQEEVQRVIETLTRGIAQHSIPPGTHLVESKIVESLQANRNHVQAALKRMSLQKIVTIEHNKGARVSKPSAQEAREVFAARRAIERAVVEALTPEKLFAGRARINHHIKSEHRAIESSDRRTIVQELSNFHLLLADLCGNAVLKDIFDNLMVRSAIIVALYQRNDQPKCQHDEHIDILHAIKQNNQERAVKLMLDHLNHLESELALGDEEPPEIELTEVLRTI